MKSIEFYYQNLIVNIVCFTLLLSVEIFIRGLSAALAQHFLAAIIAGSATYIYNDKFRAERFNYGDTADRIRDSDLEKNLIALSAIIPVLLCLMALLSITLLKAPFAKVGWVAIVGAASIGRNIQAIIKLKRAA